MANFQEKNVLLTRDDVGRGKPSVYTLPQDTHVYGKKRKKEVFGVDKLTSSWHFPPLTEPKESGRDFRTMDKMGIAAKITKPEQVREFRNNNDVLLKKKRGSLPCKKRSSSIHEFNNSFNGIE